MAREQSEAGLQTLLSWAESYAERTDMQSYTAHAKLFESFSGTKFELSSESAVNHLCGLLAPHSI